MTSESASTANNLWSYVEQHLPGPSEGVAVRDAFGKLTFTTLCSAAINLERELKSAGVRPGDRVAIVAGNTLEFVVAYGAVARMGAVVVGLNPAVPQEALDTQVRFVEARLVLVTDYPGKFDAQVMRYHLVDLVRTPWRTPWADVTGVRRDDLLSILFTSGTTARPKAVMLSHANVLVNARNKLHELALTSDDKLLCFVPLHHCYGQNAILTSGLVAGSTVELVNGFRPDRIRYLCQSGRVSVLFGVPSVFRALLDQADGCQDLNNAFTNVRLFFSAAERLPRHTAHTWLECLGRPIFEGYGLTETSPFALFNGGSQYREGTLGRPIDGVEVSIKDSDGQNISSPFVPGEICIRGANVMLGYWHDEAATRKAVIEGWLHTGDIAQWTADSCLELVGRVKDVINRGGLKVYPEEVEEVIRLSPGIADVLVTAKSQDVVGEIPIAFCVMIPGHDFSEKQLKAHCSRNLPEYKVPVRFYRAERLEKGATGKRLRIPPRQSSE